MALVTAWSQRIGLDSREMNRHVHLACDRCMPPWGEAGTVDYLRDRGWEFNELESGPHLCPWCLRRPRSPGPRRRLPPKKHPALPNLLIIGAGKSGTSSLHFYLSQHPEIHMSEIKEMRFLHLPWALEQLDLYATFFDGTAAVRGESSPTYTQHPLLPGVPERIRAAMPEARLIYLVRDPVERAISSYRQACGMVRSVEQPFGDPEDPYNRYAVQGRYATQLERYTRLFPRDQILVVDQADLLKRRGDTLRKIFRFLHVDEEFSSRRFRERANTRDDSSARLTEIGWWLRHTRAADAVRSLPHGPRKTLTRSTKRLLSRRVEPVVTPELRQRLCRVFGEEVDRLRALTGQEFSTWQV
jgi:Sulfotransferase domain